MNLSPVPKEVRLFILIEQTFRIAAGLQEQGRASDADQLYQFILAIKPDHFGSLFQLATIRARSDQLDVAMELFRQAAAADPKSADAMAGLGAVLAVDGRRDEAITCYEKALAIDPDHAGARHALGATLHALGRTAEAIALFERAIAIRPDYAEAHFGLANHSAGRGRAPDALDHYRKVVELQPGRIEAYSNYGQVLQRVGRDATRPSSSTTRRWRSIRTMPMPVSISAGVSFAQSLRGGDRENRKALELDPSTVGRSTASAWSCRRWGVWRRPARATSRS